MKVSSVGASGKTGQARQTSKTAGAGAGGFAEKLAGIAEPVGASQAVGAAGGVVGIEALLSMQEVDQPLDGERKRRWVRYGEDILDQLEELRHGLLIGNVSKEKLVSLTQMVRSRRDHIADPRLAAILDDIELRAEVELAKLEILER